MPTALLLSIALNLQVAPARYERLILPPTLRTVAVEAGLEPEALSIAHASENGLLDQSDDAIVRLSKTAIDLMQDEGERTALFALVLSYRIPDPQSFPLNRKGRMLSALLAAHIDDQIEDRERRDPYLKLPMTLRRWEPAREPSNRRDDQRAIRALGWARSNGVCEMRFVGLLNRLVKNQSQHPAIASDARRVLTGLGMLRYSPDTHCSGLR